MTMSFRKLCGAMLAVSVLTACGTASSPTTSHTITLSRQQAAAQDRAVENCGARTTCPGLITPIGAESVTRCGDGVTTNGSCVFADKVRIAVRAAGSSPGSVVVAFADGVTNPLRCSPGDGGLVCRSRVSQVWVKVATAP